MVVIVIPSVDLTENAGAWLCQGIRSSGARQGGRLPYGVPAQLRQLVHAVDEHGRLDAEGGEPAFPLGRQ
jgi:hypothetical protein